MNLAPHLSLFCSAKKDSHDDNPRKPHPTQQAPRHTGQNLRVVKTRDVVPNGAWVRMPHDVVRGRRYAYVMGVADARNSKERSTLIANLGRGLVRAVIFDGVSEQITVMPAADVGEVVQDVSYMPAFLRRMGVVVSAIRDPLVRQKLGLGE